MNKILLKQSIKKVIHDYVLAPKLWDGLSKANRLLSAKTRKIDKIKSQFPYIWRGQEFSNVKNVKYIPTGFESNVIGITRLNETKCVFPLISDKTIEFGPFPENTGYIQFAVTPEDARVLCKNIFFSVDGNDLVSIKGDLVSERWQFIKLPIERDDKKISIKISWEGGKIFLSMPFPERTKSTKVAAPTKPNIIVLILDSMMSDAVGCLLKQNITESNTPNIDKYFSNGRLFWNAYSQSEYTMPSLATMASGLYPIQHGVFTHDRAQREMPVNIPTLAEHLSNNGYRTMAFSSGNRFVPHYGHYRGYERFFLHQMSLTDNSDNIVDRAIEFNEVHKNEPTLSFLHFIDPHPPFPLPTYFSDNNAGPLRWGDSRKLYGAFKLHRDNTSLIDELRSVEKFMIRNIDFILSKLFAYLEWSGIRDNTNVLLLADHGREYSKGDPLMNHRLTRIPLLINGPGVEPSYETGFVEAALDLYPTIAHLAGLELPEHLSGRSAISPQGGYRDICKSESLFRRIGEIAFREQNWFYAKRCDFDYMNGEFDFNNSSGEWLFKRNSDTGVEDQTKNYIKENYELAEKYRKLSFEHYRTMPRYFNNDLILDETRLYPE